MSYRPQDAEHPSPSGIDPRPDIDWLQAREAVENRDHILLEMIRMFVEDCPRWLSDIDEALVANDLDRVRNCAHSFKGAAYMVAAVPLAEAAAHLERVAHAAQRDAFPAVIDLVLARSESVMLALKKVLAAGHIPENSENAD